MDKTHLLVPTDFTDVAGKALAQACFFAKQSGDQVDLLHIRGAHTASLLKERGKAIGELDEYMAELCREAQEVYGVRCESLVRDGQVIQTIIGTAEDPKYRMLIIGTHGTRGIRQNLFGPDMLKIARRAPIPVLIIPKEHLPRERYHTIVFPYGSHLAFFNKTEAAGYLAQLLSAQIHIYSVDRPMEEPSAQCKENIQTAKEVFEKLNVPYREVHEEPSGYSVGFAQQTIQYAHKTGAEVIAVMAVPSEEYTHISKMDKEHLINNESGLAILMTGDYSG